MAEIIKLIDVEYDYPDGTKAIRGLNLSVKKGEKIALMGENGSGKSTLFKLLNGTLKPAKGEIIIDGQPVKYNKKGLRDVRKRVGIVFQDSDDQLFSADVRQDISFGLYNLGYDDKQVEEKVNRIIKYFHMEEFSKKPVQFLSGGQKKRVAISDVVVMEPEIILLDEPSAGMDPENCNILDDIIRILGDKGITLIISTHDANKALKNADRVIVMNKGKITEDGLPEKVFTKDEILKDANLEKPFVVQMFQLLQEKNIIDKNMDEIPCNIEQLEDIIEYQSFNNRNSHI